MLRVRGTAQDGGRTDAACSRAAQRGARNTEGSLPDAILNELSCFDHRKREKTANCRNSRGLQHVAPSRRAPIPSRAQFLRYNGGISCE